MSLVFSLSSFLSCVFFCSIYFQLLQRTCHSTFCSIQSFNFYLQLINIVDLLRISQVLHISNMAKMLCFLSNEPTNYAFHAYKADTSGKNILSYKIHRTLERVFFHFRIVGNFLTVTLMIFFGIFFFDRIQQKYTHPAQIRNGLLEIFN